MWTVTMMAVRVNEEAPGKHEAQCPHQDARDESSGKMAHDFSFGGSEKSTMRLANRQTPNATHLHVVSCCEVTEAESTPLCICGELETARGIKVRLSERRIMELVARAEWEDSP